MEPALGFTPVLEAEEQGTSPLGVMGQNSFPGLKKDLHSAILAWIPILPPTDHVTTDSRTLLDSDPEARAPALTTLGTGEAIGPPYSLWPPFVP